MTKAINAGLLLLAFSRPIQLFMERGAAAAPILLEEATGRLVRSGGGAGKFEMASALQLYGPMLAAIVLKKAVSMVRKTIRV